MNITGDENGVRFARAVLIAGGFAAVLWGLIILLLWWAL
jgi:hypothetical protein